MQRQLSGLRRLTVRYLEKVTKSYYRSHNVYLPSDFRFREFAAQLWGKQGYARHMSFQTMTAVREYLASTGPRHFYYSSARYEQPGVPDMEQKGWRSSDLVFDIDADHLEECKNTIVEISDEHLNIKTNFIDENCLSIAAEEALRLVDVLTYELGFERNSIRVEFSGHRGFHVVVELPDDSEWAKSSGTIRRELVNYIIAKEVLDKTLFPRVESKTIKRRKIVPIPPLASMPGLRGRLARIATRVAKKRGMKHIVEILNTSSEEVQATEELMTILEEAKNYISIRVDEQVTVDTKRLVRAPFSLNGKTMLPVFPLTLNKLDDFKLTIEDSPFRDMDKIRIEPLTDTPQIKILGNRIKLRKGEKIRLPAPIALYLLAKEVAILAP